MTPKSLRNSHLVMEDVHSFVLRVYLDPPPRGRGTARPQFNLEYVNGRVSRRMQNLDEVLEELRARVELIVESASEPTA